MSAIITLAGCSVALHAAGQSPPAGAPASARAAGGEWVSGTFAGEGGSRPYRLFVPAARGDEPRALVVLLHGCLQDAADIARGTRIAEHAAREGWLVLLPEQPASANPRQCWNWFEPAHQRRGAGEPSLIHGITELVMRAHAVDPARVHLAGISAGAAMASLVAVAYPERWASLALHSGLAWRPAADAMAALGAMARGAGDADARGVAAHEAMDGRARAIPTFVIHGGSDAVVNPVNGREAARQWAVTNARALGAPSLAERVTSGETGGYTWTRTCHSAVSGECVVEELVVRELGHAWSGGSREGSFTDERGPDATAEILRFFRAHPAPPSR